MLIIPNENKTIDIYTEEYEGYPEEYTDLPYIMGVQIGQFESVKGILSEYIQNATMLCNSVEIWNI